MLGECEDDRTLDEIREDFIASKILPLVWLGDSASRFDDYTRYAQDCDTILECGVYTGLTTTAFLLAQPKKLVSIDHTSENFSLRRRLEHLSQKQGTEFQFLEMNDLDYESSGHDLLLIDTTHFYDQTLKELERFGGLTRKRIVLHDCASHADVFRAVCEWLCYNKNFYICEHDNRGDGICVLQRYPEIGDSCKMSRNWTEMNLEERFTNIWESNYWAPDGKSPKSGGGSSLEYTSQLREDLPKLLAKYQINSMFDAPCGDLTFMQYVDLPKDFVYIGGDIVAPMIAELQAKFPAKRFQHFDLTQDLFPTVDLWLCRACFFHLSFADIRKTLINWLNNPSQYLLLTNHINLENEDIDSGGGHRPLNFLLPPFNFPKPLDQISDYPKDGYPTFLNLWDALSIKEKIYAL